MSTVRPASEHDLVSFTASRPHPAFPASRMGDVLTQPLPGAGSRPPAGDGRADRSLWRRLEPVGWLGRVLLVFPAACAVFTLGILCYLVGVFDPAYWLDSPTIGAAFGQAVGGIVVGGAFNLLGPLGLAVLVVLGSRRFPLGMPVIAVASLAYTAFTFWSLISMIRDESSTAVLLLLFLPFVLLGLLVPFLGAAVLVHWLRSRARSAG